MHLKKLLYVLSTLIGCLLLWQVMVSFNEFGDMKNVGDIFENSKLVGKVVIGMLAVWCPLIDYLLTKRKANLGNS